MRMLYLSHKRGKENENKTSSEKIKSFINRKESQNDKYYYQ